MLKLRTNPLPKKLTALSSVTNSFPAAYAARAAMLSQLHGYPQPAHVLAIIWKFLSFTSMNDLKSNIKRLRDCVSFASEALLNVRLMRADRYQFQLAEIADYITQHSKEYGYSTLAEEDINFVAYLMTSSEVQESSWVLDLSADQDSNLFTRALKIYHDLCFTRDSPTVTFNPKSKQISVPTVNSVEESKYYVPVSDSLETLSSIILPKGMLTSVTAELSAYSREEDIAKRLQALNEQLDSERSLFRLADIRLIDHILSALLNPALWSSFITPRPKPDPAQNVERARGLKLFAAYLQSLLVYPHMIRFEMFKTGYEDLESWHGSFPEIAAEVQKNYTKYVVKYDFLGAAEDARSLFDLYRNESDPNLNTSIFVQFIELSSLYGVADLVSDIAGRLPSISKVRIEKLKELDRPDYDQLLLSLPVESVPLLDSIQSRMLERSRFAAVAMEMFAAVVPGYNKYFSDDIASALHALKLRVPFSWHSSIPGSFSFIDANSGEFEKGRYPMRFMAPWATSENEHTLRTQEIYTIINASQIVAAHPWEAAYDSYIANHLRESLHRQWQSFYPADIIRGTRLTDPRSVASSPLEVERLFETMTGDPFPIIRKALLNDPLSEIWATYLSSFALLFRKDAGMTSGVLVLGKGMPYGVSYQYLATMQKYDEAKDLIPIPRTSLYIALLKRIPLPSPDMAVAEFNLRTPYYFFHGNGQVKEIKHFVSAASLYHMALRPIAKPMAPDPLLLDKFWVYANDTLVLQIDARSSFDTNAKGKEVFTVPIANQPWAGDKTAVQLEFVNFGSYGPHGNTDPSVPEGDSVTAEVARLTKELEADMKEMSDSASINTLEKSTATGSVPVNEAAIGTAMNAGSTEVQDKGGNKQKKNKKGKNGNDDDSSSSLEDVEK